MANTRLFPLLQFRPPYASFLKRFCFVLRAGRFLSWIHARDLSSSLFRGWVRVFSARCLFCCRAVFPLLTTRCSATRPSFTAAFQTNQDNNRKLVAVLFHLLTKKIMLTLQNISYTHQNKDLLFSDINLTVNNHKKTALISNNGIKKSTLHRANFKILKFLNFKI